MVKDRAVQNIRKYGISSGTGEKKKQKLLEDIGFPAGKRAEYAIITGCFQYKNMPHVLLAFKQLLDHLKVDYTLLNKEYCCGWMTIGQPAVISKNDEDIARFKEFSQEFISENIKQARELGARSIVLFCAACEPNYTNNRNSTDLEVISYSELIDRYFKAGKLEKKIDYYAGCYRFRRRITDKPVDIEPAVRVLRKIEGLEVNYIDNKLCCNVSPHMEQLAGTIKSNSIVNICSGCYQAIKSKMGEKADLEVKMLPEIVWEAVQGKIE